MVEILTQEMNSCEDLIQEGEYSQSLLDLQPPRRVLIRVFDRWFLVIGSIAVSFPLLFTIWLVSTERSLFQQCNVTKPIELWLVLSILFSLFHSFSNSRTKPPKSSFLIIFDKKYTLIHVVLSLFATVLVQVSSQHCPSILKEWLWILYLFPVMLLTEFGSTGRYFFIIGLTLFLLYITELVGEFGLSYQALNTIPPIQTFLPICIKGGFIICITAARHYSTRRYFMRRKRSQLLQTTLKNFIDLHNNKDIEFQNEEWNWIGEEIANRLNFEKVFLLFVDEEKKFISLSGGYGGRQINTRKVKFPIDVGICGHVIETGKIHHAPHVGKKAKDKCPHYIILDDGEDTRSELAAPIIYNNEIVGVLDIQSNIANAFSSEDIQVISALSSAISVRLGHKYDLKLQQENSKLLEIIKETSAVIHRYKNTPALFDDFAKKLISQFKPDLITFYPLAPGTGFPILPVLFKGDFSDEPAMKDGVISRQSYLFKLITEWKPQLIDNSKSEVISDSNGFIVREGVESTVFLPLGTADERVAILFLNFRKRQTFNDNFLIRLQAMANLYTAQMIILRKKELQNSPLFLDIPDLHAISNVKLLLLIDNLRTSRLKGNEEFEKAIEYLRSDVGEVIREILKTVSLENSKEYVGGKKYQLERRLEEYANAIKHSTGKDYMIYFDIDSNIFYSGRAVSQAIFAVASEAILNGVKYGVSTEIDVLVRKKPTLIELVIEDNGNGFDAHKAKLDYDNLPEDIKKNKRGIFARLEALKTIFGSTFSEIYSKYNVKGTKVVAKIPIIEEAIEENE